MRSRNAEGVIGQALAALFSQSFRDFELLVVDSGSTDRTLELVAPYPHRLKRIEPRDYFPGRVLNEAIAGTRGEIVVFLNSDAVLLAPDALQILMDAFRDPAVQAAFARQIPRPEAHTWVRRDYAKSFPAQGPAPSWITLSLPFAGMRRSAWKQHPFYLDAWGSEDTEWGRWARAHGMTVRYLASALVMHSHNYTLRQLYGRRFIEGEADALQSPRPEGLLRAAGRFLSSLLHDLPAHLRARDLGGLLMAPARRVVFHWGWLQGHRHGWKRLTTGSGDASHGQKVVLERHDASP